MKPSSPQRWVDLTIDLMLAAVASLLFALLVFGVLSILHEALC